MSKIYYATSRDGIRPDVHMWETRAEAEREAMDILDNERFGTGKRYVVLVTVERASVITAKPREFEVHEPDAFDQPKAKEIANG